jgi:hypothetical protein
MIISDKIYNIIIDVYQYNSTIKRVFRGKCIKVDLT